MQPGDEAVRAQQEAAPVYGPRDRVGVPEPVRQLPVERVLPRVLEREVAVNEERITDAEVGSVDFQVREVLRQRFQLFHEQRMAVVVPEDVVEPASGVRFHEGPDPGRRAGFLQVRVERAPKVFRAGHFR